MSFTAIPTLGPEAATSALARDIHENAAWECTKGAANTEPDSAIEFVGAMIKKVVDVFLPACDSSDPSKYDKSAPLPPHSIRA